jgi:hypothetical protein
LVTGCSQYNRTRRARPRNRTRARPFPHCKRPICDVEIDYRSVTVCHLGAIALRLGIPLDWDPKAEHFVGPRADKGNAMISREMRSPWRLEV